MGQLYWNHRHSNLLYVYQQIKQNSHSVHDKPITNDNDVPLIKLVVSWRRAHS